MARFANKNWNVGGTEDAMGKPISWPDTTHGQQMAVLMDIRDELRKLNTIFGCHNFTGLPKIVKQIRAHTSRLPTQQRTKK